MNDLHETDILTKVTKYNLIRAGRMLHIDIHEALHGQLAGKFVAVPNLISIVAKQEYQGVGETEAQALSDCLVKIKDVAIEKMMPTHKNRAEGEES
ncbi:MAG: hypothetical protein KJ737_04915 [Proteobacteria bacterium]|nr:hypothetical protein [Pseudomonadota bacterium]